MRRWREVMVMAACLGSIVGPVSEVYADDGWRRVRINGGIEFARPSVHARFMRPGQPLRRRALGSEPLLRRTRRHLGVAPSRGFRPGDGSGIDHGVRVVQRPCGGMRGRIVHHVRRDHSVAAVTGHRHPRDRRHERFGRPGRSAWTRHVHGHTNRSGVGHLELRARPTGASGTEFVVGAPSVRSGPNRPSACRSRHVAVASGGSEVVAPCVGRRWLTGFGSPVPSGLLCDEVGVRSVGDGEGLVDQFGALTSALSAPATGGGEQDRVPGPGRSGWLDVDWRRRHVTRRSRPPLDRRG